MCGSSGSDGNIYILSHCFHSVCDGLCATIMLQLGIEKTGMDQPFFSYLFGGVASIMAMRDFEYSPHALLYNTDIQTKTHEERRY